MQSKSKDYQERWSDKARAGLKELADNLESGVPIEATEVRRVDTPDGPMHIRRAIVIGSLALCLFASSVRAALQPAQPPPAPNAGPIVTLKKTIQADPGDLVEVVAESGAELVNWDASDGLKIVYPKAADPAQKTVYVHTKSQGTYALIASIPNGKETRVAICLVTIGQPPIPPGPPKPPPGPEPPQPVPPAGLGTWAVVILDKAQASVDTAKIVDGPTLRALKAAGKCRIWDVTEHADVLATRGYTKLMTDDKLSAPCLFIMDANGHQVVGVKLPTDEAKIAELVKGSMKP